MNAKESVTTTQPGFPQEPKRPFPYHEEEVNYRNESCDISISGTLTLPAEKGCFPAVILITGHGPNDRDYTMMGHKRFLVLADYLTRTGLAVLRFDKRGVGKTTGDYAIATSRDFANDVVAGIEYLKTRPQINSNQIGLIGHSEGGLIASMLAAESKDVVFVVMMAGFMLTDVDVLAAQIVKQLKVDGASEKLLTQSQLLYSKIFMLAKQENNHAIAKTKLQKLMHDYCSQLSEELNHESNNLFFAITAQKINSMTDVFSSAWYHYLLNCKPIEMLKQIKIPMLALYGDRDWIVSSQPSRKIIAEALRKSGNNDYSTIEIPNLNHVLQTCKTGAMAEYATIEETIAPIALNMISEWILERTINSDHRC